MRITVCWSPQPRAVQELELQLPSGATVAQALEAAGVAVDGPADAQFGVWGRRVALDAGLNPRSTVR
jgi:putative ubiquitin-RnfH superfamily antitoxin RatB of RatAB toxin-antitoxin module